MPSPTPPERTSDHPVDDESVFSTQRGFTAWIAAIYAFLMLTIGSTNVVGSLVGQEYPSWIFVKTFISVLLLVPNILLSSLVWTKVYGHKV